MTDHKPLADQNETPEDVASLYSWANLHGAKYRDFSAARAQTREKARQRVQQALEEQREEERRQAALNLEEQQRVSAENAQIEALARREKELREQQAYQQEARLAAARQAADQAAQQAALEAAHLAAERMAQQEQERRAEELRAARQAAQQAQAAQLAAEQAAEEAKAAERAAEQARELRQAEIAQAERARAQQLQAEQVRAEQARAEQLTAEKIQAAQRALGQVLAAERARAGVPAAAAKPVQHPLPAPHAADQIRAAQQTVWQQAPAAQPGVTPAPAPVAPPQSSFFAPHSFAGSASAATAYRSQPTAVSPEVVAERVPERATEPFDPSSRPAWLNTAPVAEAAPLAATLPAPPSEDSLQSQRDRMSSRWFALKGVFHAGAAPEEPVSPPTVSRAPVLAIFSLAGGVGKTSLTATLGRTLSARGERVLLVDTAPYGLLPFYFGAREQRPGQLRTFLAPGSADAPVQMITVDPETLGPESAQPEPLTTEIGKHAASVSRVIVDLATASGATTRRILRLAPTLLVPVTADMNSVVSVSAIDAFFQRAAGSTGSAVMPVYLLNQFDASMPLHLDVREVLREQLGERLLPFALRRASAVSEALAEGMTVIDYAPNSTVAEDFANLAGWVKSQSAPVSSGYRGVRWSER